MASMQEMGRTSAIQAACHKYESDTLGIYKYKYSGRVEAVIETLPSTGISAEFLQKHGTTPSTSEVIKVVGNHLMEISKIIYEQELSIKKNT